MMRGGGEDAGKRAIHSLSIGMQTSRAIVEIIQCGGSSKS